MINLQLKTPKMKLKIVTKKISLAAKSIMIFVLAGVLLFGATLMPQTNQVKADEMSELKAENEIFKQQVTNLEDVATSYEDAISKLRNEISYLQGKIDHNISEQNKLKKQIKEAQIEIKKQRNFLGEYIKAMYVDNGMSTIEMLATSKDLSEFIDKEAYRNAAQRQVQETLKSITKLQSELKVKEDRVESLLEEQRTEQSNLQASRNKQQSLLSQNQSQRDEFNRKTAENEARIAELIAQQLAANNGPSVGGYYFLRFPGSVNNFDPHGYPYKGSGFSMSTLPGCGNPDPYSGEVDSTDRWGYCTRQCVSYAAWAVEASGRSAPMYYGSANNWDDAARYSGVPIHSTPQKGDVAISTSGYWGHAMYVEDVSGDQIYVSQYNAGLAGEFSYQWRNWR
jgi:peptidoglycan DL-endopeptidase CwlO